ncbi:hypothetical protein SADUNF_Sadunf05G0015200 [Salix dunnii]|uniref:Formin-like protein n=1 Tax=Salix dunnii TaxID=1413687 RepID=A0A835K699_9ROSI|nr:hypothetical protein SADUNF_Sadunf05G0015200 [Salix dunnii]
MSCAPQVLRVIFIVTVFMLVLLQGAHLLIYDASVDAQGCIKALGLPLVDTMEESTEDVNDKKRIEKVSGEDENKGKEALIVQKFRALLGPKSSKRRRLSVEFVSPAPSPSATIEAEPPAFAPAPAPKPPVHVHSYSPLHHNHQASTPQKIWREHKDKSRLQTILIAVLGSTGAAFLVCVLGFFWLSGKFKEHRKKSARIMSMQREKGRSRGRSKFVSSRKSPGKVSLNPALDLLYLNSLEKDLEQRTTYLNRIPETVNTLSNHSTPKTTIHERQESKEELALKSDSANASSSSTREIMHVHDDVESVMCESDGGIYSSGDKIIPIDCHSSDDESFHSFIDSRSSNARLSNASAGNLNDISEISPSNALRIMPSPSPAPKNPNIQEETPVHDKNFTVQSPPLPRPPPPPPLAWAQRMCIPPSSKSLQSTRMTSKASNYSTLPNLSPPRKSGAPSGSDRTPRNHLPASPQKSPKPPGALLSIPPPACPPPFLKGNIGSTSGQRPSPSQLSQYTPLGKDGAPLTKLKPLHWDKVRAVPDQSMVWDEIRSSSFELDEEMIESLFGYNLQSKEKNDEAKSKTPSPSKHVLEPKRLQNITILSKATNATAEQVCDALMRGDGLCLQQLEALAKMVPTKEEEAKLFGYKGNINELGYAEKFIRVVLSIPFAFQRVEAMLYRETFEDEVVHLKNSFSMLEEACNELRSSRLFFKLLEAVLKTGNRMNVGTIRGGAKAFKLDALLKLSDVKGTDGKTTLLHFVVQEIIRSEGIRVSNSIMGKISQKNKTKTVEEREENYRRMGHDLVSGLSTELYNVKKTATLDLDALASSVLNLSDGMEKLQQLVNKNLLNDEKSRNFVHTTKTFLNYAARNLKELHEDEDRVMLHVREITEYFHGNLSKEEPNPLRIFVIVRDFLGMLDHVCKELRSLKCVFLFAVMGKTVACDGIVEKLIEMGFESCAAEQAVKEVGPSLDKALDYILNGSSSRNCEGSGGMSSGSKCFTSSRSGKRMLSGSACSGQKRQSSILEHFRLPRKRGMLSSNMSDILVSGSKVLPHSVNGCEESCDSVDCGKAEDVVDGLPVRCKEKVVFGLDWEERAKRVLQERFGYSSLKGFQKEALAAWAAHQDCLVLAATGSGKSFCFQIPALLTGKVVVVISPLISLMHDQCLKLSKHGVSACFLGSGQPDSSVEKKAMRGMYDIIYVCPETILRLIKPLQGLAESRGITLFAIDEVHCVSKWGHDFRPAYRQLSVLRENFSACNLNFLKFNIPLMALTATATIPVRGDVLEVLNMSKETKVVLTSFFRPNLRFSVKHCRTSSPSSYGKNLSHLIGIYAGKKRSNEKKWSSIGEEVDDCSDNSTDNSISDGDENGSTASREKEMSIEYLENDVDIFHTVDDWDVACGEFIGQSPCKDQYICESSETVDPSSKIEDRSKLLQEPLEEGPTIIYVPTRKETLSITKYLCGFGVKAAAYNASLPKSHLRQVHKEFHQNMLQVVVATVAFGMGIDKSNIRRIIHYGWPQSLEAYYQEAGRAGRDGKLAECILYANLSRTPSLLPSKRSEAQTKHAYKMLSDCFRYGMNTSCCRAKILVEYFGEDFISEKCLLCDVCVNGPPEMQNLKEEADILMKVIAACHLSEQNHSFGSYDDISNGFKSKGVVQKPNLRMFITKIREQSQKFGTTDQLWWQGLARIMEGKGYIREGDEKSHVQIRFPEPTKLGLEYMEYDREQPLSVYPEADMQLSVNKRKSYSSFAEWGKGWADPEIRRQRLERKQLNRNPRKPRRTRKSGKMKLDFKTPRGRIAAKLFFKQNLLNIPFRTSGHKSMTRRKVLFMGYSHLISAIAGFSAAFILRLPILRLWHKQQITEEKLRIIAEVLEHAEERVQKLQERHDHMLGQICSYYLINRDLGDALAGARAAMNEAMEFAVRLRDVQMRVLINFPDEADLSMLVSPCANAPRPGNN